MARGSAPIGESSSARGWRRPRTAAAASARQRSRTYGQRGESRQPAGRSNAPGTTPASEASRRRPALRSGSDASSASVYGWRGCANRSAAAALSTIWPAYITSTRCAHLGDDAEVVRDQHQRHAALALQAQQQGEHLRLHGDVERGRRLVGDEQARVAGDRHRQHDALAHAARELVREGVEAALRVGDLDVLQQLQRARASRPARAAFVQRDRLHQLERDRERRVEARHRVLEDHRDLAAEQARAARARTSPAGRARRTRGARRERARANRSGRGRRAR